MASSSIPAGGHGDPTRRDFLMVATGAMGAVGAIAVEVERLAESQRYAVKVLSQGK